MERLPVIDISRILQGRSDITETALAIDQACRDVGFFYISNHGIPEDLQLALEKVSHQFFQMSEAIKMEIRMEKGGRAWRGYFPLGDELTSGKPDLKEGLYFGAELDDGDTRVQAGWPMHGANLFPHDVFKMRDVVLDYISQMTHLGQLILEAISIGLGLDRHYFRTHYTSDPLVLFRIFHYPPMSEAELAKESWGVGEHTDYGVLTLLKQDMSGGLQVKTRAGWIEAPPIENTFVCNIGDMLERLTKGIYRSTAHRVRNRGKNSRFSFPFFLDPNFESKLDPLPICGPLEEDSYQRWDESNVHVFEGTYGDYILNKVGKVFPNLRNETLDP